MVRIQISPHIPDDTMEVMLPSRYCPGYEGKLIYSGLYVTL